MTIFNAKQEPKTRGKVVAAQPKAGETRKVIAYGAGITCGPKVKERFFHETFIPDKECPCNVSTAFTTLATASHVKSNPSGLVWMCVRRGELGDNASMPVEIRNSESPDDMRECFNDDTL